MTIAAMVKPRKTSSDSRRVVVVTGIATALCMCVAEERLRLNAAARRALELQDVIRAERHGRRVGTRCEAAFDNLQRRLDARFGSQRIAFACAHSHGDLVSGVIPGFAVNIDLVACALL